MKEVVLTRGKVALVDDEDFERVTARNWSAKFSKRGKRFYARTNIGSGVGNQKTVELQRFIMGEPPGTWIDHRNGDTLDCRKENLRLATSVESARNRAKQSNNRSGFKGVRITTSKTKKGFTVRWYAHIEVAGKQKHLGCFTSGVEAALAYDAAARERFGAFARLNFPNVGEVGA
jgi:hypothetical protein